MIELRRRYSGSKGSDSPSFSRLPADYQEVEYIQNTGDSHLVLDFKSADIKFKFVVIPDDSRTSMQMGYGSSQMVGFIKNAGVAAITPVINGIAQSVSIPSSETTIHTIEIRHSDSTLIIDGVNASTSSSFVNQDNFGVFCRSNYGAAKMKGKMYVLQRNYGEGYIDQYIPCRRISSNVKGMYDIVNDVFYSNVGTGEFLCGADVNPAKLPSGYQEVEWLGNGNGSILPFIVTDLYPSKNLGFEIECSYPTDGPYESAILGCDVNWDSIGYRLAFDNKLSLTLGVVFHMRHSMTDPISYTSFIPTSNEFCKYKYIDGYCFINEEIVKEGNFASDVEINTQIALFGALRGTTVYQSGKDTKIKYISFFDGDESNVIAHLYPCYRKEDDRAGMYDIINGKFYESANESEFILGPEITY